MKILYIILFILISSVNISAQHKNKGEKCSDENCCMWNYRVTLGTWMTAMSGDVSANGLNGYIDNTFYNKYNGADFSFYGKFEAIKGRLSYSGQFSSAYQSDKFVYDKDSLYSKSITTIRPMFISGDVSWQFYENSKSVFDIYGGIRMNIFTKQAYLLSVIRFCHIMQRFFNISKRNYWNNGSKLFFFKHIHILVNRIQNRRKNKIIG